MIVRKSPREVARMRQAGLLVARCLELAAEMAKPGTTTGEIDAAIDKRIRDAGAVPLFLGYRGFPASICTSVNEELVHGIPGERRLEDGDILTVDVGVRLGTHCGDAARTFPIGSVSESTEKLLAVTRRALDVGIEAMRPGARLTDVSRAIQTFVEGHGFGVVRDYTGHGIGTTMHEDPQVLNFVPDTGRVFDLVLRPGLVLALEPMITEGGYEVEALENRWTVVTKDRKLCAHFEDTVAVTQEGREILTRPEP